MTNNLQLRCFLDGNALCIVKKGFVDPHESEAIFIRLSDQEIKLIQTFGEKDGN